MTTFLGHAGETRTAGPAPEPLDEAELEVLIDQAIAEAGASGMQDMGKVMGLLQAQVRGRADMKAVSGVVRARLTS